MAHVETNVLAYSNCIKASGIETFAPFNASRYCNMLLLHGQAEKIHSDYFQYLLVMAGRQATCVWMLAFCRCKDQIVRGQSFKRTTIIYFNSWYLNWNNRYSVTNSYCSNLLLPACTVRPHNKWRHTDYFVVVAAAAVAAPATFILVHSVVKERFNYFPLARKWRRRTFEVDCCD